MFGPKIRRRFLCDMAVGQWLGSSCSALRSWSLCGWCIGRQWLLLAGLPSLLALGITLFVGSDDSLYQGVPNNIDITETADRNPLGIPQQPGGLGQAASFGIGQVDLGRIAGNDGPRLVAKAC